MHANVGRVSAIGSRIGGARGSGRHAVPGSTVDFDVIVQTARPYRGSERATQIGEEDSCDKEDRCLLDSEHIKRPAVQKERKRLQRRIAVKGCSPLEVRSTVVGSEEESGKAFIHGRGRKILGSTRGTSFPRVPTGY